MEDIIEDLGRGFLRLLKWIFINTVIEIFVHGYGYLTLKILTLGQYPKSNRDNETICIIAGLISIVITIGVIAFINSN